MGIKERVLEEFESIKGFIYPYQYHERIIDLTLQEVMKEIETFEKSFIKTLEEIEEKIDDVNVNYGNISKYCIYCKGIRYDEKGIVHDNDCIIIKLRNLIKEPKKHLGIDRDISEGKQTEKRMKARVEKLDSIIDEARECIGECDIMLSNKKTDELIEKIANTKRSDEWNLK